MKISFRDAALALLVLSTSVACSSTTDDTKATQTKPNIAGRWKSACTPAGNDQFFSLDFDIQAATWAIDYVVFGDQACAQKFLTVRIEGPYELTAPSKAVEGAWEARFGFSKKTVTPHAAAAASFLESAQGCGQTGFAEGQPKDISASGCGALGQRPVARCGADYDLVKLEGDVLKFGARPADNDMCTEAKRPTAIAPLANKKS